jgi:HlyD family secretion protein
MKRRLIISSVLVVVAAVATVGFLSRGHGGYSATYRFVSVEKGDIVSAVTATGTLSADTTVQVGAQVSGQITQLYADFNSHVRKGELIARLDPRPSELSVQQAEAQVQQDVADSMQKAFTLEQAKPLHRNGMMTDNDFVAAQAAFEASKATLKAARANLARSQQDLAYTYVYAPIDGVVVERDVQVGQTVASSFSAPQLYLIASNLQKMQILAQVDEADIGQIRNGQTVSFTVQAYPNRTFHGLVRQVRMQSSTVDNVVMYTVVVDVNNSDGALLPGMTATVSFEIAKASGVLKVSNAAVRFRPTQGMMAAFMASRQAQGESGGPGNGRRQLTAADSARFRRFMAMRAQGGGQGGGGFAGGGPGGGFGGGAGGRGGFGGMANDSIGRLWYVNDHGQPAVMRVKIGISDGQMTQISPLNPSEPLKPGTQIIAAVTAEHNSGPSNPFQQQQQNPFRNRVL